MKESINYALKVSSKERKKNQIKNTSLLQRSMLAADQILYLDNFHNERYYIEGADSITTILYYVEFNNLKICKR